MRSSRQEFAPPQGVSAQAWGRLTSFQQQVYRAICEIPKGETRSYRWVAERVGSPAAARAVGNALNRNPFAPLVPCHRVVRSDGSLGGFAGGPDKKRCLLEVERQVRSSPSGQSIARRALSADALSA